MELEPLGCADSRTESLEGGDKIMVWKILGWGVDFGGWGY